MYVQCVNLHVKYMFSFAFHFLFQFFQKLSSFPDIKIWNQKNTIIQTRLPNSTCVALLTIEPQPAISELIFVLHNYCWSPNHSQRDIKFSISDIFNGCHFTQGVWKVQDLLMSCLHLWICAFRNHGQSSNFHLKW